MRRLDATDPANAANAVAEAARVLREGGLVAFPTETVYGLGAAALDISAVERIFVAKGRPSWNPLIVHVASIDAARELSADWTPLAERLAQAFWPGPLTIVVRRSAAVPDPVTAGLDTVGIRMPSHRIASALLAAAAIPLAAPSANRSTGISPTRAEHVIRSLGDRVDIVLDGGATAVGIESTVVDATAESALVLRPGAVTRDQIESVVSISARAPRGTDSAPTSPGQMERHYAPSATVVLFNPEQAERESLPELAGSVAITHSLDQVPGAARTVRLSDDPALYAARFYETLHQLESEGVSLIAIEQVPESAGWEAVRDRITRASR